MKCCIGFQRHNHNDSGVDNARAKSCLGGIVGDEDCFVLCLELFMEKRMREVSWVGNSPLRLELLNEEEEDCWC